jgi:diguanylate cyclase (GGDEF)-like protein
MNAANDKFCYFEYPIYPEVLSMKIGKPIKIISTLILLCCFLFSPFPLSHANGNELYSIKNILILNSYHQGLSWTREQSDGILDTIVKHGLNVSVEVEYMDWKRHPESENLRILHDYYKYKYQYRKIDVILATDDAALQFALENRSELFSDAPVIFCGVNKDGIEKITKNYDRVTGVMEVIDPTDTIRVALQINPSLKNIYLVYDNSESGLSTCNLVRNKILSFMPSLNIIPCNTMTYEELLTTVSGLDKDSIVLLTTYFSDVNNTVFETDFINRSVSEHSPVPVYQIYDFGMNNGVVGGSLISGRRQGEAAANLALQLLSGTDIADLPIITNVENRTVFDYKQLTRFHIDPSSLPKNAELINKPFSFYETYKNMVLSVIAVFEALLVFVCILLFYIHKIKRMKKELLDSHEELSQLYEELSASDEEMKKQYNEMIEINEKIRTSDEKLTFLAYHDSLTGLPNKLTLYKKAKEVLVPESGKVALIFIDLDKFKNVNDTMGHIFGDQLIIQVGKRLSEIISDKGYLYRLSGDEFVILLPGLQTVDDYIQYANEILSRFSEEITVFDSILHIGLSMGVAIYPEHGDDLEQLLKYADIAMYRAKENGRKSFILYNSLMNEAFTERITIEKYLLKALERNEFEVYFQPQYDINTNEITGLEALLRWNNPILGSVSPIKFIPIAEETRLIIPLGNWVLNEACRVLRKIQDYGYPELTVSVNISTLQLLQSDFIHIVDQTLREWGIASHLIELEITETILIESFDTIWPKLKIFDDMNIRIALDDFGKGYSSLFYLKQMPISTLKVDKSFVDHITSKDDNDLTEHIITMGKSMNMCVIAEGVETVEQLEYLKEHDCDKIQGYLFSRPIPETDLYSLLESRMHRSTPLEAAQE